MGVGGQVEKRCSANETCVVLAGGRGTRLHSETGGGNKHLLPIAGRPALAHVLAPLRSAPSGVVVTNADAVASIRAILDDLDLAHWKIAVQPAPDGTLSAIRCALPHVETPVFNVSLGDNLFAWQVPPAPDDAFARGGILELYTRAIRASDATRFAVVTVADGYVRSVHEKPDLAAGDEFVLALTGFARFDRVTFEIHAPHIRPSPRGEYEVTSLMERYLYFGLPIRARETAVDWLDYGTPESLREAERILRAREESLA